MHGALHKHHVGDWLLILYLALLMLIFSPLYPKLLDYLSALFKITLLLCARMCAILSTSMKLEMLTDWLWI